MNNLHEFELEGFLFRVILKENYVEFVIIADDGSWRKFFVSKAGYTGDLSEIKQVGKDLLEKARKTS